MQASSEPAKKCNEWALLSNEELSQKMINLPAWTLLNDDNVPKLERKFVTKDFQAGLEFIAGAGSIAERLNHHPDLHLTGYRNIQITIYTHSLGGLTDLDIMLATTIDNEVKIRYSPKFLKDNPNVSSTAAEGL
jgi:4a-hydroxytetrahydrobiopterin dehydratase